MIILPLLGVAGLRYGIAGLFRPQKMIDLLEFKDGPTRHRLAVIGRLVVGSVFILVSPYSRFPVVIHTLGLLTLAIAVAIGFAGSQRLDRIIAWWVERPSWIRVSSGFVILFGLFLIYAGV